MKTKVCYKCKKEKPLTDYYAGYSKERDGYSGRCKECAKENIKKNYKKNIVNPIWHEKEKERGREKYYRLEYRGKYKPTAERKIIIMAKYNAKYPEKKVAKNHSQHIKCKKGLHRHHWNYNEEYWKDVIILTIKDHNLLHTNMIYDQSIFMFRNAVGEILSTKQSHIDVLKCAKLSEKMNIPL